MRKDHHRRLPLAAALLAVPGSLALAPAAAAQSSGADLVLEEITVTARRREEGLQEAPIAISAFTGDTLAYRGVTQLTQVEKFVPNLTVQNNPSFGGASNSAAIYIRGVGQKEFLPTTEPGVGLYVDGVYIARSVGAVLDLIDVERLEVLRGPQGSLFGRNTIGGALSITTVKPAIGGGFGGEIAAAVGTDDRLNVKGAIDIPVGSEMGLRLSAATFQQDGYVERQDGVDLGDDDTQTARLAWAWEPSSRLRTDFSLDYTRDRENGPALELIAIDFTDLSQLQGVVAAPPPPLAFIHNVTTAALGPGQPCAATDAEGNGVTFNPDSPNCFDERYLRDNSRNAGTAEAKSDTDIWGASLNVGYEISDTLSLRSITAWRDLDSEFSRDGDHSPHRISTLFDDLEQQQFSQELQLLGEHDRFNWILGAYYFEEEGDNVNILDFTVSNFRSGGEFENESWAVFAQGTYDITDALRLTLGGRYTEETKSFLPDQIIFTNYYEGISNVVPPDNPLAALDAPFLQAGTRILPNIEKEIDIDEFTPLVNLSFDTSDDMMLYASYSEGFKSGGFTQRVFPPIVPPFTAPPGTPDIDLIPTFEPEFAEVFEIGFKSTLAGGNVRLNGALFHTDYEDLQVEVFNSVAPVTENIGSANIQGLELEMQASPGGGWLIDAMFAYLNAEYDEIDSEVTLIGEDFDFERVPEYAASLGVSKEISLDDLGTLVIRGDAAYRDDTFNDAFNTEALRTDSYTLWDASIRWVSPGEELSVILTGINLTDEDYLMTGVYGTAFQVFEGVYDRGRQWMLEAQWEF
ncbi:MAG: TonB-dependent receptor [Pseudomonadota bacterium]